MCRQRFGREAMVVLVAYGGPQARAHGPRAMGCHPCGVISVPTPQAPDHGRIVRCTGTVGCLRRLPTALDTTAQSVAYGPLIELAGAAPLPAGKARPL